MGWYGNYEIEYNGENPQLFEDVAKIYIPNYKERFESKVTDNSCILTCKRNLTWYSADFDVEVMMEWMPRGSSCRMTIDGETHPWINVVKATKEDHAASVIDIEFQDKAGNKAGFKFQPDSLRRWVATDDNVKFENKISDLALKVLELRSLDHNLRDDPAIHIDKIKECITSHGFEITEVNTSWLFGNDYYGYETQKHDELPEEVVVFRKNNDEVTVENLHPDTDRYRDESLGINDMLYEQINTRYQYSDNFADWIKFVNDNIDLSDEHIFEIFVDAVKDATDFSDITEVLDEDECNKDELKRLEAVREIFSDIDKARKYMNDITGGLEFENNEQHTIEQKEDRYTSFDELIKAAKEIPDPVPDDKDKTFQRAGEAR